MSDCSNFIELISLMVDGELSAEQESELRTHLEHCDECKKVYEAFMGISSSLSEDLVEPPEMLAKGIMFKINNQKKGVRHFAFGRYTAIAACLVLILFGASHFGLLDSMSKSLDEPVAAPKMADDSDPTMYAASAPESEDVAGKSFALAQDSAEPESKQMLTAGEGIYLESNEDTVFQLGFPTQNVAVANGTKVEDIKKEPVFLIETDGFSVYEGKYYSQENKDKNVLLFTVTDEEELSDFTELLTSEPESADVYKIDDKEFLENEPKYTLFIPADKEKNENAKDKIIGIWLENDEIWCVTQDVSANEMDETVESNENVVEKILYKAIGPFDKFVDLIKQIKKENNIT